MKPEEGAAPNYRYRQAITFIAGAAIAMVVGGVIVWLVARV